MEFDVSHTLLKFSFGCSYNIHTYLYWDNEFHQTVSCIQEIVQLLGILTCLPVPIALVMHTIDIYDYLYCQPYCLYDFSYYLRMWL